MDVVADFGATVVTDPARVGAGCADDTQMTEAAQPLSPAEIRTRANRWYAFQIERLAQRHGTHWPALEAWLKAYLREEIRQRLIAIGWRPRA